jgi:hypothetical protein
MGETISPRWQTADSLSEYDRLFLLGLFLDLSLYIGERGDISRYNKLVEMGLIVFHGYNHWNRWVLLSWRGKQIARQIRRDYPYTWQTSWEAAKVRHNEFHIMVNGKEDDSKTYFEKGA